MQHFDWNHLKAFLAVLELGSLSAASRKLAISQPTLGRHISELETALGITLFQRSRDGFAPTPATLTVAEHAKAVEEQAGAIGLAAAGSADEIAGTVRITASQIVATYVLPSILSDLMLHESELEIELVPSNDVENLLRRDADIAIRMVEPTQLDLIARRLGDFELGVFARRDYLERYGTPAGPQQMAGHLVVGYDRSDLVIRGFRQLGIEIDRHFFRLRCDDQVAAWQLVCAGCGIGFGPLLMGKAEPDLVRIAADYAIPPLPVWLVTHRELRTSARIRRVFDYLAERLVAELGVAADNKPAGASV